MKLRFAL